MTTRCHLVTDKGARASPTSVFHAVSQAILQGSASREVQRRIKMNEKEKFATIALSQDTMQTDAQGEEVKEAHQWTAE